MLAALAQHPIKALAHITGGGLLENIPRVLPDGMAAHLVKGSWPKTELFAWLQKTAGIDDIEMNRTFNNGIGMVVVIDAASAAACAATLRSLGETVFEIGVIAPTRLASRRVPSECWTHAHPHRHHERSHPDDDPTP